MPPIFFKISPMLIVFAILAVLPFKVSPSTLRLIAFALWLTGGIILSIFGFVRLLNPTDVSAHGMTVLVIAGAIGLIIGFGKGTFVLSKTSARNVARIQDMTEHRPPRHVYSKRSWIVLSLMILIAMSLNFGLIPLPVYIRGAVNLAIGFGLIISSLTYVRPCKACPATVSETDAA